MYQTLTTVKLGDHLRRKRLHSKEPQRFVAQKLKVKGGNFTLINWEMDYNKPKPEYNQRIIHYLGYTPLLDLAGTTTNKRLKQHLFTQGLSQTDFVKQSEICMHTITQILRGIEPSNRVQKIILTLYSNREGIK